MGTPDRWISARTSALLCALIAMAAGLPGLFSLPALDRNESAFVQATVQMLESGDFVAIRYQDYWRGGASPGAHWLQAALVELFSSPEAREIWAYRIASLIGAATAAAATAWGGAALFGARVGLIAGAALALSLIVSTAAGVATADAPFLGACAVMLTGLGRIYQHVCEELVPRRRHRVLFWSGLIAAVMIKGPLGLILPLTALTTLAFADRRGAWVRGLGWGWGLIALFALAGPWVVAVTIATDGDYWSVLAAPSAPAAPPLWLTWLAPAFLFPTTALLPAAAVYAWKARGETGVRVALAFLLPGWLIVELWPSKQVFSALPLYLPVAWLAAAGLLSPLVGRTPRLAGAVAAVVVALIGAGVSVWAGGAFGEGADQLSGLVAAVLFVGTGFSAAVAVMRPHAWRRLAATGVLALLAPGWLLGATLPSLQRLWPTERIMDVLDAAGLDPREGLAIGPVAAAGYAEPSLVFALGASTETGGGELAARAIAGGRPAIVEAGEEASFQAALVALNANAEPIARLGAYDYAAARDLTVTVYRQVKP